MIVYNYLMACLLIGNGGNRNQVPPEKEWRRIGIKLLNFIPVFTNNLGIINGINFIPFLVFTSTKESELYICDYKNTLVYIIY